jgi:L,D-peptidoglycan transpeptidase YkuD (ErfK/YbiS/YcfS/YnhG family)
VAGPRCAPAGAGPGLAVTLQHRTQKEYEMATERQRRAARRNVKKAQVAAKKKRTIAHLPRRTRTALGKQGAAVARRKRTGSRTPATRAELYEEAKTRNLPGRSKMGSAELARALGRS